MNGAAVRLTILGQFRIEDGEGRELTVGPRKARGLLAYLAIRRGEQSRDRLAGLLWGEMGQARARANLRQCVMKLRAALGDRDGKLLVSDDDAIRLADGVEVDAHNFSALAAGGALAGWEQAVRLYGGDLLGDFRSGEEPFDDWLEAERHRFARAACDVLSRVAAARRAAGEHARAEQALERWLLLDPACEEAHRALIEIYNQTDRRWKALEQFERCKRALQRTFGVEPAPATAAMFQLLCAPPEAAVIASPGAARLPLPSKPCIAVLPFESAAPDEAYFGDGMADDVLIGLSRFEGLLVMARQSSFAFRDRAVDLAEISRALGAHYVLQGSVRRAGPSLRVSVVLTDATRCATAWAERYDRDAGDLFGVLDDITRTIITTVARRVEADQLARVRRAPTGNLDAYDLLLKAKAYHHRHTLEDNAAARECLERAITMAPHFGLAHAWMACSLVQLNYMRADREAFDRGFEYVKRALELEDGESECHRIIAAFYLFYRRFPEAQHHQRRALELNPNDDKALCQMGEILTFLGRPAEALPWIEQAMRLNPYHGDKFHGDHGMALYGAGRLDEATAAFQRIRTSRLWHLAYRAAIAGCIGDGERASADIASVRRSMPGFDAARFVAGLPYQDQATADRLLEDLRRAEALAARPVSIAR